MPSQHLNEAKLDSAAAELQVQADAAYQAFGQRAPSRVFGETMAEFARRLVAPMLPHSKDFGHVDVGAFPNEVLTVIAPKVFADAAAFGNSVDRIPRGQLRERITSDRSGRRISNFEGDTEVCWGPFKLPVRAVSGMGSR